MLIDNSPVGDVGLEPQPSLPHVRARGDLAEVVALAAEKRVESVGGKVKEGIDKELHGVFRLVIGRQFYATAWRLDH
jgi:hypothetical protein